jgi:hypothetical protein
LLRGVVLCQRDGASGDERAKLRVGAKVRVHQFAGIQHSEVMIGVIPIIVAADDKRTARIFGGCGARTWF